MNTMKTINYYRKDVYGNTLLYVSDKFDAAAIRMLTGKKTIDAVDMSNLKHLGCTFTEVMRP
jgi:hypothetical protein